MDGPVVVVGVGQLGGALGEGFLRAGRSVIPVRRGEPVPGSPASLVLVAVAEDDLAGALASVPPDLVDRVALLQNELIPAHWERAGIAAPTVAVVWFERKAGGAPRPILPTPVGGPHAAFLGLSLEALGVPWREVGPQALRHELVRKTLYLLTANLGALATGAATVGELWRDHAAEARAIGEEILEVQEALLGGPTDRAALWAGVEEAVAADPAHGARGRAAPRRLERARQAGRAHGVPTPSLDRLAEGR